MAGKPRDGQPQPDPRDPHRIVGNTDDANEHCDEETKRYWTPERRAKAKPIPMPNPPAPPPSKPADE